MPASSIRSYARAPPRACPPTWPDQSYKFVVATAKEQRQSFLSPRSTLPKGRFEATQGRRREPALRQGTARTQEALTLFLCCRNDKFVALVRPCRCGHLL